MTATAGLPEFVSHCSGNAIAKASSACTRFMKTYTSGGDHSTSSSGGSASSTSASASITLSPSTISVAPSLPTPTSFTSSASPSSTCAPLFALDGASERAFNPAKTPFSLQLACGTLDATNYTVFASTETESSPFGTLVEGTTANEKAVTIPGFGPGKLSITLAAFDMGGDTHIPVFFSAIRIHHDAGSDSR